jgi:hypothetical protein
MLDLIASEYLSRPPSLQANGVDAAEPHRANLIDVDPKPTSAGPPETAKLNPKTTSPSADFRVVPFTTLKMMQAAAANLTKTSYRQAVSGAP